MDVRPRQRVFFFDKKFAGFDFIIEKQTYCDEIPHIDGVEITLDGR